VKKKTLLNSQNFSQNTQICNESSWVNITELTTDMIQLSVILGFTEF